MEEALNNLNSAQQEAVKHINGPLLILAGAGSGKTKTLTTRLAYLIDRVGVHPHNTLTLTFTNKAAKEMRKRAISLIDDSHSSMPLLCTFHKFGFLFLKFNIDKLNRASNFVIIDNEDRKKILKRVAKDLNIDLNLSFIQSEISKYKNNLLTPDEIISKTDELKEYKKITKIYKEYQKEIVYNNLVDFDDLLMLTYQILKDNDELRVKTSRRYRYIMVDEYQDTNELQFKLLELLVSEHNNLCVVGDDDQSIYGWRGANVRNILEFSKKFKDTKIVKLEINYRSTIPIIEAANELIEHNNQRIGKRLISHKGKGKKVKVMHSINETIEAQQIASEVKKLLKKGVNSNEIAVLYRINALSRSLEEGFHKESLAFKLLGGTRFYDRAEIKDIISYFRLIANTNDDFSLERVINRPKRGVGKISIAKLKKIAFDKNYSIFQLLDKIGEDELLKIVRSKKAIESIKKFVSDIRTLKKVVEESLDSFIDKFEELINIKEEYKKLTEGLDKRQNIDEFYAYFNESVKRYNKGLDGFLNEVSLQSEQDQVDDKSITIMSIHASKGLEFEHLYVIGLEERFFPLLGEGSNMEEERRLGYVAITRAKSRLTLCYADSRFYMGKRHRMVKSRFLGEAGLIKGEKFKITKRAQFKRGDLVKHKLFGIGRVQSSTKLGKEYKLNINFGGNRKEILSSFVQAV